MGDRTSKNTTIFGERGGHRPPPRSECELVILSEVRVLPSDDSIRYPRCGNTHQNRLASVANAKTHETDEKLNSTFFEIPQLPHFPR